MIEYAPIRTGESYSPILKRFTYCKKYLRDNKHNRLYLPLKMGSKLGLSFLELYSWKLAVRLEQMMSLFQISARIFSCQMGAIIYCYLVIIVTLVLPCPLRVTNYPYICYYDFVIIVSFVCWRLKSVCLFLTTPFWC